MAFLKRILLPVDFSDRSYGAVRYAEALASPTDTEIVLLHVTTPLTHELVAVDIGGTVLSDIDADRRADGKTQLETFLKDELSHFRVTRVICEGDPAHRITEYAHKHQVDLIAMPTHGYGLFRRFLLGSVTSKVLHDADCPVWTGVHLEEAPEAEKIHFRHLVAAVDLCHEPAVRTLKWARDMAKAHKADLTIVHAFPSLEGRAGEYFDPNWRTYFRDMAITEINKFQGEVGIDCEVIVESGEVDHVTCGTAEKFNADALVIGRGSAAGVFGRIRAHAYEIIRQSPCPVISV
jgi:nucleotide-binding universal stress UspA family protein